MLIWRVDQSVKTNESKKILILRGVWRSAFQDALQSKPSSGYMLRQI
uniref:Uncharacterized protein n=1 Tax=Anguilla anguilla TaxID=7936 RepID=A0A0E9PBL7_ANGAN